MDHIFKNGDYLFELRSGFSPWSEYEAGMWSVQEKWACGFEGKTKEVKAASFKLYSEIMVSLIYNLVCLHQYFKICSLLLLAKFIWEIVYLRRKEAQDLQSSYSSLTLISILGDISFIWVISDHSSVRWQPALRGTEVGFAGTHISITHQHHLNLAPHACSSADQKWIKRRAWLKGYQQFNKMLMPLPALRPSTIFFPSLKPTLSKVSPTLKRQRGENGTH